MSYQTPDSNPTALITANRSDLAALIAKGLQRQQWSAVIANEGHEIMALLNGRQFQVFILDLDWLGEIGLGLLTQLRQANSPTPIVVMTSYEELGDRAYQTLDTALTVLIKPFKIQDIVQQSNLVSQWNPAH